MSDAPAIRPVGEYERTPGGAVLMDGIRLRGEIIAGLRARIEAAGSPPVCLATVLVGDDRLRYSYVAKASAACRRRGHDQSPRRVRCRRLQSQVEDAVAAPQPIPTCTASVPQLPRCRRASIRTGAREAILPDKDVDGLGRAFDGSLVRGLARPCRVHPAGV
ncbi:MAG: hypothetical protein R2713_24020 [Ilumatobacteraceae bacterium]